MGLSNKLSCEAGSFSRCSNLHRFFSARGFEALFNCAGTLGCMVCLAPQLFLLVYLHNCGIARSTLGFLAVHPVCPSCLSLPLLPVLVNVSTLTHWLSDFHTVQFSGSSGYFLFLDLLLSFFWLYKEAKCIYLCLHLGWKSPGFSI